MTHAYLRPAKKTHCRLLFVAALLALTMVQCSRESGAAAGVSRYIRALQERDFRTVVDLTYSYQTDIARIKHDNPRSLWPRLVGNYYQQKVSSFSSSPGLVRNYFEALGGAWGDPTRQIRALPALFPRSSRWKITESRTEAVRDGWSGELYDRTTVYVQVNYPSLDDAPYIGGRLLGQTTVAFTVRTDSGLVMNVSRIEEGDAPPKDQALTVFSASWQVNLSGLTFTSNALGGTLPYSWTIRCDGIELNRLRGAYPETDPRTGSLFLRVMAGLPDDFPIKCQLIVHDAGGHSASAQIIVPQMSTPLAASYCWQRNPWKQRGLALPATQCMRPLLELEQPATGGRQAHLSPTISGGGIHSINFKNLAYSSRCWQEYQGSGFDQVVQVSDGQWQKGAGPEGIYFSVGQVIYGDLNGDGQDDAVVQTSCGPNGANAWYEEVFVFTMSPSGARLLARLSPSDWGENALGITWMITAPGVRIKSDCLVVSFLAGGSHAQPQWLATAVFHWEGNHLVRIGVGQEEARL